MSPPISVSPEAAFIAASAASQIVTNDHDSHANTWYDEHGIEPSGEPAIVSTAALHLVNNFLDQLLFNFLSLSRSTSLAALRPAVTEVLKPKLAKDAINQADEELREYLGGGDDDDMLQLQRPSSAKDWDIELVWKRTRLRCMVYSSLGDLEEEDEDLYMEQEQLDAGHDPTSETVSPAVSIFLTSILEFMGEQALISAGQAAYHRMRFIYEKDRNDSTSPRPAPVASRITVEEVDMDRVAFDRTIGRLWRSWKKRIRSPITDAHHVLLGVYSDDSGRPSVHLRQYSQNATDGVYAKRSVFELAEAEDTKGAEDQPRQPIREDVENAVHAIQEQAPRPMQHTVTSKAEGATAYLTNEEWLSAAISVPLPIDEKDIAEILIPGFAYYDDEEGDGGADGEANIRSSKKGRGGDKDRRPKSLMIPPSALTAGLPTPTPSEPRTPEWPSRKRANSLPTPTASPYLSPRTRRVRAVEGGPPAATEEANKIQETADADADDEGDSIVPESRLKRSRLVTPLVTAVIGAAITTVSPKAVSMAGMMADDLSDTGEEIDEEFEEFSEEPQILTSSRISISGRSNSPTSSDLGRPLSICPVLPPGSPRVIDVSGPRSPVSRSRNSSMDAQDPSCLSRPSDVSRASSISTPPIVEEVHEPNEVAAVPRASHIGAKVPRTYKSDSISEAEEETETGTGTQNAAAVAVPTLDLPPQPTKAVRSQSITIQAVRHSATRPDVYASPISSPLHPSPPLMLDGAKTKVTVLGPSAPSRSFYFHDTQDDPFKPTKPTKETKPAATSVPERSTKREAIKAVATAAAAPAAASDTSVAQYSRSPREMPPPLYATERGLPTIAQEPDMPAEARTEGQARAQAQVRAQPAAQTQAAAAQQSPAAEPLASPLGSKFKARRTSEESTAIRPEDMARNFEQLIQSDQTIQYTLTPENMRDIDVSCYIFSAFCHGRHIRCTNHAQYYSHRGLRMMAAALYCRRAGEARIRANLASGRGRRR